MNVKIRTTCAECGTPFQRVNLNKRDELYYCTADFQRLSPEEKLVNARKERELEIYKSMFDGTGV